MNDVHKMILSIRANDLESVEQLIQQGVELNITYDNSPLVEASQLGHLQIMRRLIEAGADINLQMDDDGDRDTALMRAALHGQLEAVKLLIEMGADPDIKNMYQETASSMAAYNAQEETFYYLDVRTNPKWEPGIRVLAEAKRRKEKMRNRKG